MPVWRITYPLGKKSDPHGNTRSGTLPAHHKITSKKELDYLKKHFAERGNYAKGKKLRVEKYRGSSIQGKPALTTFVKSKRFYKAKKRRSNW